MSYLLLRLLLRSINSKALNLHTVTQSPQAVHLSGYSTAICAPVLSSTASGALIINYMNNFTLCTFTPVKMTEYKEQDQAC